MNTTFNALSLLLAKASLLLIAVANAQSVYTITPPVIPISQVIATADVLSSQYGSRPPYSGLKFAPGEPLSENEAATAAPYLLACESRDKAVGCVMDDNGKLSCGPGQFQDWSTFWGPASGISGDANDKTTAATMMLWGLENGYIQRWGCAKIIGLI